MQTSKVGLCLAVLAVGALPTDYDRVSRSLLTIILPSSHSTPTPFVPPFSSIRWSSSALLLWPCWLCSLPPVSLLRTQPQQLPAALRLLRLAHQPARQHPPRWLPPRLPVAAEAAARSALFLPETPRASPTDAFTVPPRPLLTTVRLLTDPSAIFLA